MKQLLISVISVFLCLISLPIIASQTLVPIKFVLDWTPNTNHTGIVVAQAMGYYKDAGLDVKIYQPGKGSGEQLVSKGMMDFGISYSSSLVAAASKEIPIVSIAAIIAHNTSGFYSVKKDNITRPKDFENKTYGGWGSKTERATIKTLVKKDGGNPDLVKIVTIGTADVLSVKGIDFVWGYEAWQGIIYKIHNIPVNYISILKYKMDSYSPIMITSKQMINKHPDIVRKFTQATAKGYYYAIKHPKQAAQILLNKYPELNHELVILSQQYLANKYQDDSPYWGYQSNKIWQNYVQWYHSNNMITKKIDISSMFTNQFSQPRDARS